MVLRSDENIYCIGVLSFGRAVHVADELREVAGEGGVESGTRRGGRAVVRPQEVSVAPRHQAGEHPGVIVAGSGIGVGRSATEGPS